MVHLVTKDGLQATVKVHRGSSQIYLPLLLLIFLFLIPPSKIDYFKELIDYWKSGTEVALADIDEGVVITLTV